jgi:hypothetical protein
MIKTLYVKAASDHSPNVAYLPITITVNEAAPLVNFSPRVVPPPVDQLIEHNFLSEPSFSRTINLPAPFDSPGDTITTVVNGLASFMTFSSATNQLSLISVRESDVGVYNLQMRVADQLGAFNQYSFKIEIKAIEPPPLPPQEATTES